MLSEPIKAREAQLSVFLTVKGEEADSINEWLDGQSDSVRIFDVQYQVIPREPFYACSIAILHSKTQPQSKKEPPVKSFRLYRG